MELDAGTFQECRRRLAVKSKVEWQSFGFAREEEVRLQRSVVRSATKGHRGQAKVIARDACVSVCAERASQDEPEDLPLAGEAFPLH